MRTYYLKELDRHISVIALGTVAFGTTMDEKTSFEVMDIYCEMGGSVLDTARVYGDFANDIPGISEETIGRWLRKNGCRKQIVLSTKGGHPPLSDMHAPRLSEKELQSDLARSLEALQTDYADIYYLHRDDETMPVSEIMETLHSFVKQGLIRMPGASNWSAKRIREANEYAAAHGLTPFSANEPQWSCAKMQIVEDDTLRSMDGDMLSMHEETGMLCMPFTSQAKGFFSKLAQGGEEALSDKAKRRYLCAENLARFEVLKQICARHGFSVGAGALAYLTSRAFPVCPIAGVSSTRQAEALREAGDAVLSAEEIEQLGLC